MASANYETAIHRANAWLADVAAALGSQDRHYAQRMVRTWLHILRDRLTVEAAAKFGQQLPELMRGIYYDGWEPHRVPVKFNAAEYVHRFATDAFVPAAEVPAIASAITRVMDEHMSPGQVAEALAELPGPLRATIRDGAPVVEAAERFPLHRGQPSIEERLTTLTEAVLALARGIGGGRAPGAPADPAQAARAARIAEEVLIAAR